MAPLRNHLPPLMMIPLLLCLLLQPRSTLHLLHVAPLCLLACPTLHLPHLMLLRQLPDV